MGQVTYLEPLSPGVVDVVFEGGPSRLNAFPFYPFKGLWMSPFPDRVLLSPPAEGGLLLRIQALCRCGVGDVT